MVTNIFKNIKDKDVKTIRYSYKHHPWGPDELGRKIYLNATSEDAPYLRLIFPVPDIQDYGKQVSRLINNSLKSNRV